MDSTKSPKISAQPANTMEEQEQYCISCGTEMSVIDADPNGYIGCVCAKCTAEESHDFDVEPDTVFNRAGRLESEATR